MTTHIKAFIPDTDPEFQKHKKVLLVCHEAEVSLPAETMNYFGTNCDQPYLTLLDSKLEFDVMNSDALSKWKKHVEEGYEIDITKLPKGVTKIRFCNSW